MARGELVLLMDETWVHAVWKDEEGLLHTDCEKNQQAQQLGCIAEKDVDTWFASGAAFPGAIDMRSGTLASHGSCRWGIACPRLSLDEEHTVNTRRRRTPQLRRALRRIRVRPRPCARSAGGGSPSLRGSRRLSKSHVSPMRAPALRAAASLVSCLVSTDATTGRVQRQWRGLRSWSPEKTRAHRCGKRSVRSGGRRGRHGRRASVLCAAT